MRVDADEVKAIRLQIGHGSWNDEMKKVTCGLETYYVALKCKM